MLKLTYPSRHRLAFPAASPRIARSGFSTTLLPETRLVP